MGAAERIVVVAADEAGEASAALAPGTVRGAVATLVCTGPLDTAAEFARLVGWTVRLERSTDLDRAGPMDAHRALLPLAAGRPERLEATMPWGGFANARLLWL
jgi:hypothetical protein